MKKIYGNFAKNWGNFITTFWQHWLGTKNIMFIMFAQALEVGPSLDSSGF
jgi:hypothetical protein